MGKFKGKRWLAGAMAVMLCCSSFLQTGVFTVSAEAETEVAQEAVQEPMGSRENRRRTDRGDRF